MQLPYDIIYHIYFYIDDYSTVNNFWILSKQFNKNYMTKYNRPYIHKYKILYNDFFLYLQYLNLRKMDITISLLFNYVSSQRLNKDKSLTLINDVFFIYNLYKKQLTNTLPSQKHRLLKEILCSGPNYLDRIFSLEFNKSNITIKLSYYVPLIDLF